MAELTATEVKGATVAATITAQPIHPDLLKDLQNRFEYHKPFGDLNLRYEVIRSSLFQNAKLILSLAPKCAEQTTAIRKLEEAMMWANAAIARNSKQQEDKAVSESELNAAKV